MLAILLAAGRGRRMGRSKALLELAGRPALLHCVEALAGGGASTVRVVLPPGSDTERRTLDAHAAELAARCGTSLEVAINPQPELGQTSSLLVALAAGFPRGEVFLLHTVDHPLVTAADVSALHAAWMARDPWHSIVLPAVDGRRGHPALFATALLAEFLELAPDRPAHLVVRRQARRVRDLLMTNPWLVADLDTPEDLRAARAALGGQQPRHATER